MEIIHKVHSNIKKYPVLSIVAVVAVIIWSLLFYKIFIDEVNLICREIGAAFAK